MIIENAFSIGDVVYLKTDDKQLVRMVIRIIIMSNELRYVLACGTYESVHGAIEIAREKDELKTLL